MVEGEFAMKELIKKNWKYRPFYDESNYIDVILPEEKIHLTDDGKWIIIGWPGVDGITFRIKANATSPIVYVHYPIEDEIHQIASDIEDLISKWKGNKIIL